jgi:hypothetical protein
METTNREWARLAPGQLLLADENEAWLEPLARVGAQAGVMLSRGSVATTRKLLDGAVGAAFSAASPLPPPPLTRTRWVFRLAGLYHLTRSTTSLMREASAKFEALGRGVLAAWAGAKAREEHNHDLLAIRDIEALGYDAHAVVRALVPEAASKLVAYFQSTVRVSDPIGCVGYSYALERLALTVGEAEIHRVDALLPGVRATRCLRVHSAIGGDTDHVEDTVRMVASLTGPERTQVAIAAYQAARLCFEPPADGHPSDEEIERSLH